MGVISGIKDKGVLFGDVAYRTSCSFKNRGLPKMVSWCRCMSSLSLNTEPVGRGIVCIPGRFRIPVQTYPTCPDCIQTTRRLRTEDCCKDQKLRVHFNISAAFLCGEEALILSDKIWEKMDSVPTLVPSSMEKVKNNGHRLHSQSGKWHAQTRTGCRWRTAQTLSCFVLRDDFLFFSLLCQLKKDEFLIDHQNLLADGFLVLSRFVAVDEANHVACGGANGFLYGLHLLDGDAV